MKDKILEHLHEQFAQNQNDHDRRFISFFIALLALFASYGIIYSMNLSWIKNNWDIGVKAVCSLSIIVGIVLSYFIFITLIAAKTFRRDQLLNDRIRFFYLGKEKFELIFISYSAENKNYIEYIPDFLKFRLFFLLVNLILVILSIAFLFCWETERNLIGFILSLFFLLALLFFCICFWRLNFKKFQELESQSKFKKDNVDSTIFSKCNFDLHQEINTNSTDEQKENSIISQTINDSQNSLSNNTTIQQSINLNLKK